MKTLDAIVAAGVLGAAVLGYVGVTATRHASAGSRAPARRTASDAEESRKQQLLRENTNLGPDPGLADEYDAINTQYFAGRLPTVPVRWEERLSEIGPMIADRFRLEGLTNGRLILINPVVRGDARQLRRVLCHEMVHVAVWDSQHEHGPAFQTRLRQLADAGAFEGIVASDEEKEQLHEALRSRRLELEHEDAELSTARTELDGARQQLDAEIKEFNARMAAANERQGGWPSAAEQAAVKEREGRFQDRVNLFNARVERHRADIADFDRDVERYNLMIAYPDGLDRDRLERKGQPAG